MLTSTQIAVIAGVFFLLILLVIFMIPSDQKGKVVRGRKNKKKEDDENEHDYVKLEKSHNRMTQHVEGFKKNILLLEKKIRILEKNTLVDKVKLRKMDEKLVQEQAWAKKEEMSLDKGNKEMKRAKEELVKVQDEYAKEHSLNIKYKHELKVSKNVCENMRDEKLKLDLDLEQVNGVLNKSRKEYMQLKQENAILSKKQNDVNWIAKTEFDKLQKKCKEQEKEIGRLSK